MVVAQRLDGGANYRWLEWKAFNYVFQTVSGEDFKLSQHKEMETVWSDGYSHYPDLTLTHYKPEEISHCVP